MLPGVTRGQDVLLGPFSGICLILCWHLIYLITIVTPPSVPSPLDFFRQGSPNLRAKRTAPAFLSPSGARNGLNFVSSGKAGQQALILGNVQGSGFPQKLTAGSSKAFYGSLDPIPLDHSLRLLILRHLYALLVFLCLIAQRKPAA